LGIFGSNLACSFVSVVEAERSLNIYNRQQLSFKEKLFDAVDI
jgi:hypothetical protein